MAAKHATQQPDPPGQPLPATPTAAERARLQRCFERGQRLLQEGHPDYDYAHTMFAECVQHDPGNVVYVDALLDNLRRRQSEGKRAGRFRWPLRPGLKRAHAARNWPAVFQLGIAALKSDPGHVPTLRMLADACDALGLVEAELRYLRAAVDAQPKNLEVHRHCGRLLARLGHFDQAIACWRRVDEGARGDPEAQQMISEITLARTLGIPPSFRIGRPAARPVESVPEGAAAAGGEPPEGAPAGDGEPMAEAQRLEQLETAAASHPGDPHCVLPLVDAYRRQRRFADAEQALERCLAAGGNHLAILDALDEMRLEGARARLEIAQRRAEMQHSPEATQLAVDLQVELNRLEMEVYYQRSERYPNDLRVRYQLGRSLKRAGNFLQAMKYLQEAAKLGELSGPALLEMGECLQHLRQFGRALEAYRAAIRGNGQPDPEIAKLALYRAGLLAAALGQTDEARGYLVALEQQDAGFRDVQSHLDKLGRIGHKG